MRDQLLDCILRYINGLCGRQDLESWVLYNLQRILDSGDRQAIEIANKIDGTLVALGENLIDERTFRDNLLYYASLRDTIELKQNITLPAISTEATAAVSTISTPMVHDEPIANPHIEDPTPVEDRPVELVFG